MEMRIWKTIILVVGVGLCVATAAAQDKSKGGIKGKIKVETGSPSGVLVLVRQGDREVAHTTSDRNGSFSIQNLTPGVYGLTFRKTGLSVGTKENFEVKAGQSRSLDQIFLPVDEGSITFLRGSVFDQVGRSVPNARVELARILDDGSLKKLDSRVTNQTGQFVFRLTPEPAKYRVTAKADGMQAGSKDVDVDSAAVYRLAISLNPNK